VAPPALTDSPRASAQVAATQVVAGRVVLVGDAAHMGSPNTGAGCAPGTSACARRAPADR